MNEGASSPPTEAESRRRFMIINLVRISGVAITLLGIALWQPDLIVPGRLPILGAALILAGLLISLGGTRVLVRRWRTPPAP